MFTTRPDIKGSLGVVASTHWLASSSGMAMMERGGNAFDATVAAAFVLQVVQPNLVGPGGDVPIIFHSARTGRTEVLCGQAPAPKAATIDHYKREGLELIPGNGMLATVIPGSFDAWMLLLRDHGRLKLRDVLEPALHYAGRGHPLHATVSTTIARLQPFFEAHWPSSAAFFVPGGRLPHEGETFRNETLAHTWRRLLREAEAAGSDRESQIEGAREAFYRGFVAEEIDRFVRETEVMDGSGAAHRGVLCADDMASWQASYENTVSFTYHGHTVHKTDTWGQGPVFLQMLAMLAQTEIERMDVGGAPFVHTIAEATKLAFADREFYYGDPRHCAVPLEALLAETAMRERAKGIGESASGAFEPSSVPGYEDQVVRMREALQRLSRTAEADTSVSEPTLAAMRAAGRGDTVHIDAADGEGNLIAAMPSGGWFQSSPMIPALGFMLNSRAQMFWLEKGLPCSLEPGRRPRTTLSPTLVHRGEKPYMAFGSPGGDQQDQWQMQFFLRHLHGKLGLQEAIDMPMFYTAHAPSSFFPREQRPAHLAVEESFGQAVVAELRARGHLVETVPAWTLSSIVATAIGEDGWLRAAATPRLMQAYAVGR